MVECKYKAVHKYKLYGVKIYIFTANVYRSKYLLSASLITNNTEVLGAIV